MFDQQPIVRYPNHHTYRIEDFSEYAFGTEADMDRLRLTLLYFT